jgi:CotH kinase protein/Lamin Tail Domain/Secretion system C-terminal sorting domain
MKGTLLLFSSLLCFLEISAGGQDFTDSNLPIFIINTDGGTPILDDPRVLASMKIIYRGPGQRNYLTDQDNQAFLNYNGRINIEIRGSSSQVREKKQYGFSTINNDNVTNNNVSLLGMPSENDWVLNGMVFDPALIRDYLCYNLSRQIGEYASRTVYCELVINGEYRGLYLLQEKIKADDNRVDIVKIEPTDNFIPEITGGYITKADKLSTGDPLAWRMTNLNGTTVDYIHEWPKPQYVTALQNTYIETQFLNLASTAGLFDDSFITGYPSVIDVRSFIDHMIISELSSNADSYQYSTYFHKDRNGKLRAGPVWDNDLTFGNDLFFWGYDRSKTYVWQFMNGDNEGSQFWKDLYNDPTFRCYFAKRWNELIQPGQPLNPESIGNFIDQTIAYISEGASRDNAIWNSTGDLAQRISEVKVFVNTRIPWITNTLGSYSACSNVAGPPLVISKIMYHPDTSIQFPESDEQEFIEITNNGSQTADLTGVYFGGTGLVYQFPAGFAISANSSIVLGANVEVFCSRYGFFPDGRFSRHLSNKGQDIVLCNGFGDIIDHVSYKDTLPWPDADGNGYYLKLTDLNSDNNDPANWTASRDIITSNETLPADAGLVLFPNPVSDILYVRAGSEIFSVTLLDFYGHKLMTGSMVDGSCEINMARFPEGLYFVKIQTSRGVFVRKVIRD